MEHDEQAARLEREADKLERESERVGDDIEATRREWEARKQDTAVPGAQPADEAETGTDNPAAADAEDPDDE